MKRTHLLALHWLPMVFLAATAGAVASALGLILLREQILGTERFDWAFRKFIADWAFRHPTPSDFFRAMESEGGEDLGWFWRGWYMNNWTFDLAVDGVRSIGDSTEITLVNKGPLVMPAKIEVTFLDGSQQRIDVPVETWIQRSAYTLKLRRPSVTNVVVDPDHVLPDDDRSNNSWPR